MVKLKYNSYNVKRVHDMNGINESALIEALLFLESDPLSVAGIVRKSTLPVSTVESSLSELQKKYEEEDKIRYL